MQFNLIDPLMRPEAYVRVWRDSERYVEPVTATSTATSDSTEPKPNVSNISVPTSQSSRYAARLPDKLVVVLVAFVALLSHMPQAIAAPGDNIGSAVRIVNLVTAAYETDERRLATGDNVRQDELIEVSTEGTGEIRLRDDTKLALGPGSRLLLDEFVYNPDIAGGAIVLNLIKGTFRFITGIAAKPAYVIRTPTASITVRGTIFDVFVPDSRSASSWLLLIEGAIEVCNERDECRLHDEPGKLIRITPAGDVGNPVNWANLPGRQEEPFVTAFPFVVAPPLIDPNPIFTPPDFVEGNFPEGPRPDQRPTGGPRPTGGHPPTFIFDPPRGHPPINCKRRGGCGHPPTFIFDPPRGHPPTICKRRGGCGRWNNDARVIRDRIDRRNANRAERANRRATKRAARANRRAVNRAARANRRNAKRANRVNRRRNANRAERANRVNRRRNANRGRRGMRRGMRRGRRRGRRG